MSVGGEGGDLNLYLTSLSFSSLITKHIPCQIMWTNKMLCQCWRIVDV